MFKANERDSSNISPEEHLQALAERARAAKISEPSQWVHAYALMHNTLF